MNPTLLEKARDITGNDKVLVNLISRRVRQLSASSRPLVAAEPGQGFIDIALQEVGEGKIFARPVEATA